MPAITNSDTTGFVYSPEVKDIISQKPTWIVQHGITLFFVLLCAMIAVTWFIQYPDIVHATAKLVSVNPPIELKTKTAGKLVHLYVSENDSVQKGAVIAVQESVADASNVLELWQALLQIKRLMSDSGSLQAIKQYEQDARKTGWGTGLGEVQEGYRNFVSAYQLFRQYLNEGYYVKKRSMLSGDLVFLQKLQQNYLEQKTLLQEDVGLAAGNFSSSELLNKNKVVADVEFRNEKSRFIGKKMSLPQVDASLIGAASALHEKQKEIQELENNIAQQKTIFIEALNSFIGQLEEWQNIYLLKAPFAGRVVFPDFMNVNQYYPANQTICILNPGSSSFYGQVFIRQNNFGKTRIGQQVLLKLPAYPHQEFGSIKGKLSFISTIPADSGFAAKITLPNGLHSSTHKALQYREGLLANAEIITSDRRLIERLFSSLSSMMQRD